MWQLANNRSNLTMQTYPVGHPVGFMGGYAAIGEGLCTRVDGFFTSRAYTRDATHPVMCRQDCNSLPHCAAYNFVVEGMVKFNVTTTMSFFNQTANQTQVVNSTKLETNLTGTCILYGDWQEGIYELPPGWGIMTGYPVETGWTVMPTTCVTMCWRRMIVPGEAKPPPPKPDCGGVFPPGQESCIHTGFSCNMTADCHSAASGPTSGLVCSTNHTCQCSKGCWHPETATCTSWGTAKDPCEVEEELGPPPTKPPEEEEAAAAAAAAAPAPAAASVEKKSGPKCPGLEYSGVLAPEDQAAATGTTTTPMPLFAPGAVEDYRKKKDADESKDDIPDKKPPSLLSAGSVYSKVVKTGKLDLLRKKH